MIDTLRDAMAALYASNVAHASAHNGLAGNDGSNEIPGVTRGNTTWHVGTAGTQYTDMITLLIPANQTVVEIGLWDSSGVFQDSVPANVFFEAAGAYTFSITYTQPAQEG